jgi:hypothetical protein
MTKLEPIYLPRNSGRYPIIPVDEIIGQFDKASEELKKQYGNCEYISKKNLFELLKDILPDYILINY